MAMRLLQRLMRVMLSIGDHNWRVFCTIRIDALSISKAVKYLDVHSFALYHVNSSNLGRIS